MSKPCRSSKYQYLYNTVLVKSQSYFNYRIDERPSNEDLQIQDEIYGLEEELIENFRGYLQKFKFKYPEVAKTILGEITTDRGEPIEDSDYYHRFKSHQIIYTKKQLNIAAQAFIKSNNRVLKDKILQLKQSLGE